MGKLKVFDSVKDDRFKIIFNLETSVSLKYSIDDFSSVDEILEDEDINKILNESTNPFILNFFDRSILNVTILLTLDCNFRCPYCFESLKKVSISNKLNVVVDFLKKFIFDNSIKHLNINFFGGEPLLEIENIEKIYDEMYYFCKLNGVSYNSTITTNGYLLDKCTYKKLEKMKVNTFQITIDEIESIHNKYRYLEGKGNTFDKIVSNLKDETIKYMDEYFKFFIETFGKYKNVFADFHEVVNFSNGCKSELIDSEKTLDIINRFIKLGGNHVPILWRMYSKNSCISFDRNSFVIFPSGDVLNCSVEKNLDKMCLGNVKNYTDIKNKIEKINFKEYEACEICDFSYFCKNGDCFVYEQVNKSPRCVFFKNYFYKIIEILENQDLIDYTLN